MAYKYITGNNLYQKQSYMYSKYGGTNFLKEYMDSRQHYLNLQEKTENRTAECGREKVRFTGVMQELSDIRESFRRGKQTASVMERINIYTKSFEVRKRLYEEYDDNLKPADHAGFENYMVYLIFAECLVCSFRQTAKTKYLSCLLKLNDTLLSIQDQLSPAENALFRQVIRQELHMVYELAEAHGIHLEEVL